MSAQSVTKTVLANSSNAWAQPNAAGPSTIQTKPQDYLVTAAVKQRANLEAEIKRTNDAFLKFIVDATSAFTALKSQNAQLNAALITLKGQLDLSETARKAEKKAHQQRYKRDLDSINEKLAYLERAIFLHSHPVENPITTGLAYLYTDVDPSTIPMRPGRRAHVTTGIGSQQHNKCQPKPVTSSSSKTAD